MIIKLWKQITRSPDDLVIMMMKMPMTKMRTFTLKELARSFSETILRPFVSCVGSSFPFFGSWMETILIWTMMMMMNMISVFFDSLYFWTDLQMLICWRWWWPWKSVGQWEIQQHSIRRQLQSCHSSQTCIIVMNNLWKECWEWQMKMYDQKCTNIRFSLSLKRRCSPFIDRTVDIVPNDVHGKEATVHDGNSDCPETQSCS